MRVPTLNGATLPISQLATLEFEKAPTQIQRYNRERAATIDSDVQRGFNTAKVTADVVKRLDAMNWPRGYHYILGGEAQSSEEAFGGIGTAIIVAVFGIFAILVLEFGNFKSTLIVLTVVPLGVLGGLLMLLVTGNSISFTAAIGFIALVGIEIKNSILLVDFTNQLREQGVPLDEAIEQRGRDPLPADPADLGDGDRRPAAAGTAEHRALLADVVGDHRRAHLLDAARPARHPRDVQAACRRNLALQA